MLSEHHEALAALSKLKEELRFVRDSTNSGVDGLHPSTVRAALALNHVVHFLEAMDDFAGEKLTADLWSLLTALGDLEAGKQSPLLVAAKRSAGGRPPMQSERQMLYAKAAVALDALIRFRGLSLKDASERVAKELLKAKYRGETLGPVSDLAKTIRNWRERLEQGEGGTAPPFALKAWQTYKSKVTPELVDLDVEGWLAEIRSDIQHSEILRNPPS